MQQPSTTNIYVSDCKSETTERCANSEMQLVEHSERIPGKVDVLITHRPPLGILDGNGPIHYGSAALLSKVLDIKPRLHLFGHIHNARGNTKAQGTRFFNSSVCDDSYNIAAEPILINLKSKL